MDLVQRLEPLERNILIPFAQRDQRVFALHRLIRENFEDREDTGEDFPVEYFYELADPHYDFTFDDSLTAVDRAFLAQAPVATMISQVPRGYFEHNYPVVTLWSRLESRMH